jgi:hypothetical protein
MADVNPISIKRFIKPKTKVTNAIKPKSVASKYRAKTDIFARPTRARIIVEAEVHLTPEMVFAFNDITKTYNKVLVSL